MIMIHQELKDLNMQMSYTKKHRFVVLTEKYQVANFLAEMTNFGVILTEKCGDASLITYLFLQCNPTPFRISILLS